MKFVNNNNDNNDNDNVDKVRTIRLYCQVGDVLRYEITGDGRRWQNEKATRNCGAAKDDAKRSVVVEEDDKQEIQRCRDGARSSVIP
jgi:hypothetical protein